MTTLAQLALSSAASLLLYACDAPAPVEPAANLTNHVGINSDQQAIPHTQSRRDIDRDQGSGSANKEPSMSQPDSTTTPPPARPTAKPPAAPPRRVILPSPTQIPAEIDPVLPDPGDEVPR